MIFFLYMKTVWKLGLEDTKFYEFFKYGNRSKEAKGYAFDVRTIMITFFRFDVCKGFSFVL